MDPVSLTASITALVQISASILSYVRDIKDSSEECRKLWSEISSTRGHLDTVKDTVNDVRDQSDWAATLKIFDDPDNPIKTLSLVLEPLKVKLEKEASARGFKRVAKSLLWPLANQATTEVLQTVERQKSLLIIALQNDHLRLSAAIKGQTSEIQKTVQQIQEDVATLKVYQQDESNSKVLSWLSTLQYENAQVDVLRQHHLGTATWFLESPQFHSWLQGHEKILFCPGIPGSGKTVISSLVVQHLLEQHKDQLEDVAIAWVYCNFKLRDLQTASALLGSIAMQTARRNRDSLQFVSDLYYQNVRGPGDKASLIDVMNVLQNNLETRKRVFVIVDALDECSLDNDVCPDVVGRLRDLNPAISLMVTARPVQKIIKLFVNAAHLPVLARKADLLTFIRASLERPEFRKHLENDNALKQHIEDSLIHKSQGIFLMTKLCIESLRKVAKYSKGALRRAAETLPDTLNDMYDNALERINAQEPKDTKLAKQVISWILYTFEFLSPRVLQQALSKQNLDDPLNEESWIDTDLLVDICAGLVMIDQASQTIRLVHYTAGVYLLHRFDEIYLKGLRGVNYTCLCHALDSDILIRLFNEYSCNESVTLGKDSVSIYVDTKSQRLERYIRDPLAEYALRHVNRYCMCNEPGLIKENSPHFREFHRLSRKHLERALHLMFGTDARMEIHGGTDDLRFAALFNMKAEVYRILNHEQVIGPPANIKARALCLASWNGYDDVVTLLLDAGADPSRSYGIISKIYEDEVGSLAPYNALEWAMIGGRASTIQIL